MNLAVVNCSNWEIQLKQEVFNAEEDTSRSLWPGMDSQEISPSDTRSEMKSVKQEPCDIVNIDDTNSYTQCPVDCVADGRNANEQCFKRDLLSEGARHNIIAQEQPGVVGAHGTANIDIAKSADRPRVEFELCPMCPFDKALQTDLNKSHIQQHFPGMFQDNMCRLCSKMVESFLWYSHFFTHIWNGLMCGVCSNVFPNDELFNPHQCAHGDESSKPLQLIQEFGFPTDIVIFYKREGVMYYKCALCDMTLKGLELIKLMPKHYDAKHGKNSVRVVAPVIIGKIKKMRPCYDPRNWDCNLEKDQEMEEVCPDLKDACSDQKRKKIKDTRPRIKFNICPMCPIVKAAQTQMDDEHIARHLAAMFQNNICRLCSKPVKTSRFFSHFFQHVWPGLKCGVCCGVFASRQRFNQHVCEIIGECAPHLLNATSYFNISTEVLILFKMQHRLHYKCAVCGLSVRTLAVMYQHCTAEKHHKPLKVEADANEQKVSADILNYMSAHRPGIKFDLCPGCPMNIAIQTTLDSFHIEQHLPDFFIDNICNLCSKKVEKVYWADHFSGHVWKGKKCKVCDQVFSSSTTVFNNHKCETGPESTGVRRLTSITFSSIPMDSISLFKLDGGLYYKCIPCQLPFRRINFIFKHFFVKHPDLVSKEFSCSYCGTRFFVKYHMLKHEIFRHTTSELQCTKCKEMVPGVKLQRHMKDHLPKPTCHVCQKVMSNKDSLERHLLFHKGVKLYACKYCPKTFSQISGRNRHHTIHTGERTYQCKICFKWFGNCAYYTKHVKNHTKVKVKKHTLKPTKS